MGETILDFIGMLISKAGMLSGVAGGFLGSNSLIDFGQFFSGSERNSGPNHH
jgi:hypothetical protein